METTSAVACEKEGNKSWFSVSEWWGNILNISCLDPSYPNCFSGILADVGEWNTLRNPSLKFSNTKQTLQPVEGLDPKSWTSSKTSSGIGKKKKTNYWIFSQKVLKQTPTKDFNFHFIGFFSHFTLLWNATSLAELWRWSLLEYFHIYCFTFSTNLFPVGNRKEQQSIMTVVPLRTMKLVSRNKLFVCEDRRTLQNFAVLFLKRRKIKPTVLPLIFKWKLDGIATVFHYCFN